MLALRRVHHVAHLLRWHTNYATHTHLWLCFHRAAGINYVKHLGKKEIDFLYARCMQTYRHIEQLCVSLHYDHVFESPSTI